MRKSCLCHVSNKVRHKQVFTATEAGQMPKNIWISTPKRFLEFMMGPRPRQGKVFRLHVF